MKRKIYWNMCLIALLAVFLSSVLTTMVYYGNLERQMRRDVVAEAHYLETGLDMVGMSYLDRLSGNVRGANKNRITLVAGDGTVLYDNFSSAETMENHSSRPEIQKALKTGSGSETRISDTLSDVTFYYALLLDDGTVIRVANTTKGVMSGIAEMLPMLLVASVIILAISMVLADQQTRRIVKPINELNLDHPAETKVYDELAPLVGKVERQQQTIRHQLDTLRATQREFNAITENMSEGFIVVGKWGDVASYNTSALRILGVDLAKQSERNKNLENDDELMLGAWDYACKAVPGRGGGNRFHEKINILSFNRSQAFRTVVEQALAGQHSEHHMELHERVYQVIANPVQEGDEVTGAIIVILDVTEKERREHLRREFSANVSHELKTPLTSISGYAEIMKNGLVRPEDMVHFSENIYKEAQRMITLIEDIIKLSRLDEDKTEVEKTSVDLYELSKGVLERLKLQADKQNVQLLLEGTSEVLLGTSRILDEMIYNLCDNGIKYNNPGGYVKVTVTSEQGQPVVCVEDNGIGIPDAAQERVFERFYRVDKSHSRQIGGTGLGLSIVKHGAAHHGARVEMESAVGVGTKIRIVF